MHERDRHTTDRAAGPSSESAARTDREGWN